MVHPARREKAEDIVRAIDAYMKAYVARYVHMASNDEPIFKARNDLAEIIATAIK